MEIVFCPRCGTRFVTPNFGPEGYLCWCKPLILAFKGTKLLSVEFPLGPLIWGDPRALRAHSLKWRLEYLRGNENDL